MKFSYLPHSVVTTHYLLKKYIKEKELREVLLGLMEFVNVISVSADVLKKGLRSNHKDFEDAIQIFCASTVENIDCIVTRNTKDYKTSEIKVQTPDEFCLSL